MQSSGTSSLFSRRSTRYVLAALILIAAVVAVVLSRSGDSQIRTTLGVADALAADTAGFRRADRERVIAFPSDHGPHPEYRTEWWYYTGNVAARDGRRFGYQLTIFRTALSADTAGAPSSSDSLWSTDHLYMAHFALVDPEEGHFYAAERFSRGAAGLAGAESSPFRVWLEDWSVSGSDADSVRLQAAEDDVSIDLHLARVKPVVLHGEHGFDAKGPEPGNASYYYSMTRLRTAGTIAVGGRPYEVAGWSWMDHEWSTSALGEDQVGWDWFSLQLEDGREIMYYRLRREDGSRSDFSSGSFVEADGSVARLDAGDVILEPITSWRSPQSGIEYPVAWSLSIPNREMKLRIDALLNGQELIEVVAYWEGAVRISGTADGFGYVELTGYGDSERRFGGR